MNLRIDRLATVYLAAPFLRLTGARQRSIPILMYHSISDDDESATHPYYRTKTSPAEFAAQMKWLQESGYNTCTMDQAVGHLQDHALQEKALQERDSATGKLVVITFDDGYRDFYQRAFPVLREHNFCATVFLPTAYIGETSLSFKGTECLTWSEVRELRRNAIWFGSHTVTHPQLRERNAAEIRDEIVNSKRTIEEKLGSPVDSFAYPYAFPQSDHEFKKSLRQTLTQAGYRNGVCTTVGRASRTSDPFFMERLPVNSLDDAALFKAKLIGGYDWIAKTQYLAKIGKASVRNLRNGSKYNLSNDLSAVQ